jgi:purine nucleoside phosphorylase
MTVRDGGTYGHVDGPRLNTASEIAQLAAAGVTCVSQTGGPETVLAGEARLPFALIGFVTDHANGVMDEATPPETLARLFGESAGVFQAALRAALPLVAADPGEAAGILFAL